MPFTLSKLAELVNGSVVGEDVEITGLAGLDDAKAGDLVFVENPSWLPIAEKSPAAAVIVPEGVRVQGKPCLEVQNPRLAFADALSLFYQSDNVKPYLHPTAVIGEGCNISPSATLMAHTVIGNGVTIGDNTVIYPHVYIGDQCVIGDNTVIYPNVTIRERVKIGNRVRIHSGAVIGSDGFGYVKDGEKHVKMAHLGTVEIEDDVEIGSCTCIDRAKTGVTRIGQGTKIDNLVQIAHNCQIGKNCIIIGQVGLCGSVKVEDNVVIAGQAGIHGHRTIGRGAVIGAQAGVIGNVPPGVMVSGYPAREHSAQMRIHAAEKRLPELLDRVKFLEARLKALEEKLKCEEDRDSG